MAEYIGHENRENVGGGGASPYCILPLVIQRGVVVDPEDLQQFVSTFRLNQSFQFQAMDYRFDHMHPAQFLPAGPHIVVHTDQLSILVQNYQFFTVDQLLTLCNGHHLHFASSSKAIHKGSIQKMLLDHHCDADCGQMIYLFKMIKCDRRKARHKNVGELSTEIDGRKEQFSRSKRKRRALLTSEERATQLESNRTQHDKAYALAAERRRKASDEGLSDFPRRVSEGFKRQIIDDWQNHMDPSAWVMVACAVCGQRIPKKDIHLIQPEDIDFSLLQNPHLPDETRPTTYNLQAYEGAILCPKGLHCKERLGPLDICPKCETALVERKKQPKNSLANWHYTGVDELPADVKEAFRTATMFDIMMVARSRATQITQLYSNKKGSFNYQQNHSESQRYDRGNVSIIPQDSAQLRTLLPPDRSEIQTAMAVLFSGGNEKPSADNIRKLSPCLVSKTKVCTLLDFLLKRNLWYQSSGVEFSLENLNDLFTEEDQDKDTAVPQAVELCWLPPWEVGNAEGGNADYTDRGEAVCSGDSDEMVMEAVGYAAGDKTPQNYKIMKASALAWCLSRKKFIKMRGGTQLLSDRDPAMLTYLFPHLDPWGIAGFYQSTRTDDQQVSFERQVKNLLMQHESPFQADPNFAYVCWNILQKREVSKTASFRTNLEYQQTIVTELNEIGPTIPDLIAKWQKNPNAQPSNRKEKKAMKVLDRLKLVAKHLRGSSGYKVCRRNEIRALMKKFSTPALFITINPADVYHLLLGVLGGRELAEWQSMDRHQKAVFVARNPGPAAQFFDAMIKAFLDIIVRHGKEGGGLFGECETFYGMVEAQGRGTLHCHLLLWIKGNPSPQELRDRLTGEDGFRLRMFDWIESIIKCELPGMTEILEEPRGPIPRPPLPKDMMDPRSKLQPHASDMTDEEFAESFRGFVEELAIRCNWHEHKATCWKHVKPGAKKGDPVCRMRINGKTRSFTDLDEETQSILIKRLHPRINNYNEVVLFLMQCNMDIKYIGSGEAAKALVYYVTDYITKESLATHVGLEALAYAIQRNDAKYQGDDFTSKSEQGKSLFIKTVNAMMGRQEMSHQQVLSYLIGAGDHYKANTFRLVKWAELDRHIRHELKEGPSKFHRNQDSSMVKEKINASNVTTTTTDGDDHTGAQLEDGTLSTEEFELEHGGQFTLQVEDENLIPENVVTDYCLRSTADKFDQLSIWEHAEWVLKITKRSEQKRTFANTSEAQQTGLSHNDKRVKQRRGRTASARGDFSCRTHPNFGTHTNRIREVPFVPVLLGEALPRGDRSPEERDQWCRAMMILFKPWRKPTDLKGPNVTWSLAYESTVFNADMANVIKNMNIENECKDARDEYNKQKRNGNAMNSMLDDVIHESPGGDIDSLDTAVMNDNRLDRPDTYDDEVDIYDNTPIADVRNQGVQELVGLALKSGLFQAQMECDKVPIIKGSASQVADHEKDLMCMQKVLADEMKKDKRPAPLNDHESMVFHKRQ